MPQIMPIEELRNTNEISDRCHTRREKWKVYSDIEISEEQIKQGKTKDARKALRSVREKSTAKIYINESGVRA